MNELLIRVALAISALCAISCTSQEKKEHGTAAQFKNVIFIVSDDHSAEVMGAYGNAVISTPNLDKLANSGTFFRRAYSNAPICSASRQSMLTGKYPHATGVNLLFTPFPDDGNVTVAEILRSEGFRTALIGKSHFNHFVWGSIYENGMPNHGFELTLDKSTYKKHLANNPPAEIPADILTHQDIAPPAGPGKKDIRWLKNAANLPHKVRDADSEGTYFAQQAIEFIRNHQDERFCVWLAFHEPHAPFYFPVEFAGKYNPDEMPLPKGSPEDDRWIPEMFRDLTEEERRGIIAAYYTSVEYMDKNVGLVVDALEVMGIIDSTLVVYVGDHGYLLNDHKRFEKHTFWEESVKAPLIVAGGRDGLLKQGMSEAMVEFIDIVPTALDLLGVPQHPDFQGSSFAPLALGQTKTHKEYVFSEYLNDNKMMVAGKKWKYIFTSGKRDLDLTYTTGYGASGIYHKLYDLENDPEETTNLANRQEHQALLQEMQQRMLQYCLDTHPDAKKCPQELSLIGKLVWFSEPRDVGGEYTDTPYRIFFNEEFRIDNAM